MRATTRPGHRARVLSGRLLILACLIAPLVAFPGNAGATVTSSDNFARANGNLGPNWTDMTIGGLSIVNQAVAGTNAGGSSGDIRTAETYGSDQYSQVTVTSTQLSGGQWIGPAVRAQAGGQDLYVGLYFWNSGSPELMLFLRDNGNWSELGLPYPVSPLAAGTTLTLTAVGSTISFSDNGTVALTANDPTLSGGAPGIIAYGTPTAGNWAGGDAVGGPGTTTTTTAPSTTTTTTAPSTTTTTKPSTTTTTIKPTTTTTTKPTTTTTTKPTTTTTTKPTTTTTTKPTTTTTTKPTTTTTTKPTTTTTKPTTTTTTKPTTTTTTKPTTTTTTKPTTTTTTAPSTTTTTTGGGTSGDPADNFARANGNLGPNWTDMTIGGLSIVNQAVAGTNAGGSSGDIRTAETYGSDQYSQVTVTSTQLSGGQWIGPAVRAQAGGQDLYVGLYFWNSGSPELMLFLRDNGNWSELGLPYPVSPLAAGTTLTLTAVGSTISFSDNGTVALTANDPTLSGGAPGIIAYGTPTAGNWAGGDAVGGPGTTTTTTAPSTTTTTPSSTTTAPSSTTTTPSSTTTTAGGTTTTTAGGSTTTTVPSTTTTTGGGTSGNPSDNFARANGSLGPNWTDMTIGGLTIVNQAVAGTNAGGYSGDIRTAESYGSDQYSQVTVTSTQLSGSQWVGPAVRAQAGGQDLYVGVYFWNGGSPELMLFLLNNGTWSQLGAPYPVSALAAGTTLTLTAVGSTLTFSENGTVALSAIDATLSGGAPGIMASGTPTAGNWSGGNAGFAVTSQGIDASGVQTYDVQSPDNGYGIQTLRVLRPTNPAAGMKHNFLFVLPVEGGTGTTYGDGLATLQALDAEDQYNLTIVEPTFTSEPWYANSSTDPNLQYESFMTTELAPWVDQNLATSGTEQNWLIGFSKSGYGAQDLILKNPNVFALAASWDFPADMSTYNQDGSGPAADYGSQANFAANYELTQAFIDAHKSPFLTQNRIWIGGYSLLGQDVTDYSTLLTSERVLYTMGPWVNLVHSWDSGWVAGALAGLHQDSIQLTNP